MNVKIIESKKTKFLRSKFYNFNFNKENGFFVRWGETQDSDPMYAPGPEILDIEISAGKCSSSCKFCYKSNSSLLAPKNMTFEQFKTILDKMPKTLTQIAFGITDIDTNPDFFPMMEYCREKGVVPNFTCNGSQVTEEIAKRVASLCGAVAVSVYNKNTSYNAIKKFTEAGMSQVNIHFMLSEETYDKAFEVVSDIATDERLKKLNAIVFLAYKPKGHNPEAFHTVKDVDKYKKLMQHCEQLGVGYGMDSCSAGMYISAIQDRINKQQLSMFVESCESSRFSYYINVKGEGFHCSFAEGIQPGLNVLECNDFIKDIWNNELTKKYRYLNIKSFEDNPYKNCGDCSKCIIYPSINSF